MVEYLRTYHHEYTTEDVVLSKVRGYLQCTKPCPRKASWYCREDEHFHTIGLHGVGYPDHDSRGRFVSQYRLWDELKESGFPREGGGKG